RASRTAHSAAVHVPRPGDRADRGASARGVEVVSPFEAESGRERHWGYSRTTLGLVSHEIATLMSLSKRESHGRAPSGWLDLHVSGGNGRVAGGEAAGRRAELAAGGVVARGRECDAAGADVLRINLALDDERNVQGAQLAVVVLGGVDRAGGPRGEVEGGVGAGDDEFLARPPGGIEAAGRGLAPAHRGL